MAKEINSVTLLGSSSGRNVGDAALISGIMDSIDQACGRKLHYEIPSLNPAFITKTYTNDAKPISIMPWTGSLKLFGIPTYRSIMRTDLSLVFDATLFDRSLWNPFFNFLSSYSLLLPTAKRRGKRLGFFNVTAGPVYTKKGQEMLKRVSELMDFITVRDQDSYDILREIGVQNPNMMVTADAALNAPAVPAERIDQIMKEIGLSQEKEILAVNINPYIDTWASAKGAKLSPTQFVTGYAAALSRFAKERNCTILFLSTQHLDVEITRDLMTALNAIGKFDYAFLSNRSYSHYEVKGVLSRVSLLFAMRLHAMILATSVLAPTIGLAYLPKCTHYFRSLELQEWMLQFDGLTSEALYQHISKGWEARKHIRSHLEDVIPTLKDKARIAAFIVRDLSRGESIDHYFRTEEQQHRRAAV